MYITLAPILTGLISHYKYSTLYNIYTITNNYNHTSHKYIIYYTCIFVNMYSMKNVRISSDILDMVPCICTYTCMPLLAAVCCIPGHAVILHIFTYTYNKLCELGQK